MASSCYFRTLTDLNRRPDANGLGNETVFAATHGTGHLPAESKRGA